MVDNYASWYPSLFTKYSNGTAGHAPVKGDVLSFSDVSTFNGSSGGHTAVVQLSTVNSSTGNGTITIVEENGGTHATGGSQVLNVNGWKVQYSPHPYVKWLHYKGGSVTSPPPVTAPAAYRTGRQVKIEPNATTGVSGHTGPGNTYASNKATGANQPLWIVCYVTGQSITNSSVEDTTTIWDLSDNGYYYTDAWLNTGSYAAVVPACHLEARNRRQVRHRRALGAHRTRQQLQGGPGTQGEHAHHDRLLRDRAVDHELPLQRHHHHLGPRGRRLLLLRRVALHRDQRGGSAALLAPHSG